MTRQCQSPHIAILLALYNGAQHLGAQLDSLAAQHHQCWSLLVSDDGSADNGATLVAGFSRGYRAGQVRLITRRQKARQGAAANFRFLLGQVPEQAEFAALCDQDDVWLPDKLEKAVAALQALPSGQPALWCSRVTICDQDLRPLGSSPALRVAPSFPHALVENILRGNTVLLNRAAIRLIAAANAEAGPVVMHDWWIYQLVTGAGGQVIHDDTPSLLYRQHGGNVVGARQGLGTRLHQLRDGRFARWRRMNLAALQASAHRLTPENRHILTLFAGLDGPLAQRVIALKRGGFHRQSRAAQLALWAAVLARRC